MNRHIVAIAGVLLAATGSTTAQNFPTKPITMVIPFAAGGPTDVLGRVFGQRMSEILGQQIVMENVGGAGGQSGSKRVAEANPDGYTIVLGTVGTHAQGQTLYKLLSTTLLRTSPRLRCRAFPFGDHQGEYSIV